MSTYTITITDTPKGVAVSFHAEGLPNTPARATAEIVRAAIKNLAKPPKKEVKRASTSRNRR